MTLIPAEMASMKIEDFRVDQTGWLVGEVPLYLSSRGFKLAMQNTKQVNYNILSMLEQWPIVTIVIGIGKSPDLQS